MPSVPPVESKHSCACGCGLETPRWKYLSQRIKYGTYRKYIPEHHMPGPAHLAMPSRFWKYVRKTDSCWEWIGAKFPRGYGSIKINGKTRHATQVCWELMRGPILGGMWVLHRCDNPPCVNPEHLYLGTAADNGRDRAERSPYRGEKSATAKLTQGEVDEIRRLHSHGMDVRNISRRFRMGFSQIHRIVRRQSWK
jgi:hypothetical protein